ncbi:hypothetical protein B4U80_12134 [Leptotrombidium deliense]|uniref:N-acetyltransferase domain-containing protein n=1 Tax=Leptotrombidium deliense TaxID=299467 RepID=A0A443RXV5_9ACAR|nr:hypothetical protein B4U80_12134 [Leptotrombidium deliense]
MESRLNSNESLRIRRMKKEDIDEVSKLFADTFALHEPMSVHLGHNPITFLPFAVSATKRCAKESLSYICEDLNNDCGHRIVGFCLNETLNVKEIECESINDDNYEISALLTNLEKKWLHMLNEDCLKKKIFHLATVGVHSDYNNRGIASKLISASLNNAKDENFDFVVLEATAIATQKIFKDKYKFRECVSQVYEEFEFKGKRVFEGLTNPKSVIVFEKELKDWPSMQIKELMRETIDEMK